MHLQSREPVGGGPVGAQQARQAGEAVRQAMDHLPTHQAIMGMIAMPYVRSKDQTTMKVHGSQVSSATEIDSYLLIAGENEGREHRLEGGPAPRAGRLGQRWERIRSRHEAICAHGALVHCFEQLLQQSCHAGTPWSMPVLGSSEGDTFLLYHSDSTSYCAAHQ